VDLIQLNDLPYNKHVDSRPAIDEESVPNNQFLRYTPLMEAKQEWWMTHLEIVECKIDG
jgi:hypothetical protein